MSHGSWGPSGREGGWEKLPSGRRALQWSLGTWATFRYSFFYLGDLGGVTLPLWDLTTSLIKRVT